MTTKVRIEIEQADRPVLVERSDGLYPKTIISQGQAVFEYVHGNQTLTVREVSMAEENANAVATKVARLQALQERDDVDEETKQVLQAQIEQLQAGGS